MATTIQISDGTKQLLERAKAEEDASSYDEVIKKLLQKYTNVPKTMFGCGKGMKSWSKKDRMMLNEL
ncbi:hypothetical protein J4232_06205 [Candidatus Woesearchaeota archaeon]|nr:hypothetical protein [Candidatus Woesearchaeota archaeon]